MQSDVENENAVCRAIRITAENALKVRPVMREMIVPFADLFLQKERFTASLNPEVRPEDLPGAAGRLSAGIPVLATLSLDPWEEILDKAFLWMLPAVRRSFPAVSGAIDALSAGYPEKIIPVAKLSEDYLDGSFKHYDATARAIGIDADALGFTMRTALSAALGSLAPEIWAQMEQPSWVQGICPICGALPVISFLSKPPAFSGEFLTESGGLKFLHCGLCGHDWRFDRHTCPICSNTDPDTRFYLSVPDCPGERVDICRNCGLYLPGIDMRERDAAPHLDTAAVCLAHLDMLAREQGFNPLSDLPWNRFDR